MNRCDGMPSMPLGAIGKPAVEPLIDALAAEKEAFDMEPILHICDAAHGLAAIGCLGCTCAHERIGRRTRERSRFCRVCLG